MSTPTRIERDSMGEMAVPVDAYYGAQTARAVESFPVSGRRLPRSLLRALGLVKHAAARANVVLGELDREIGDAIAQAALEVAEGLLDEHFPVDVFQTGSGTSSNMNANEVVARRAEELLRAAGLGRGRIHPNDHVNRGQSSNDVIPSSIHVAALLELDERLLPALHALERSLSAKAAELDDVVKIGRTHLQDAVPVRLGQELAGYASMVRHGTRSIQRARGHLLEIPMGGTAVGTELNAAPGFAAAALEALKNETGLPLTEPEDRFEAQGARDALVALSGALRNLAVSLTKVANDIRWLASGPRAGLGEINIPPLQPGSSIMPGKVNPVLAESLLQVCARVMGNDVTVAISGMSGNFELNAMMPVMADALLESLDLLSTSVRLFAEGCIDGITANREKTEADSQRSLALATRLVPTMGYDGAAELARAASEAGTTVLEAALLDKVLPAKELERILDPKSMTRR